MKLSFLAFTDRGLSLANTLAKSLGGEVSRCKQPLSLSEWTKKAFAEAEGLVFVGAVGIAVRAIAPYVEKKWLDPAVVAVDERGNFAIPLLSGHLGGANDLARKIGAICGATAVITTATDINGVFAVDQWAKYQNLWVANPEKIKVISGKLLANRTVSLFSRYPILGTAPLGVSVIENLPADVAVSVKKEDAVLTLVPKAVILGIGCRKDISKEAIEQAFFAFVSESGLYPESICGVGSIDLKKEEKGLLAFCSDHGWPFETRSAEELSRIEGDFTPSAFVSKVTGVDNVCERSAVAVSKGTLWRRKFAFHGVTIAAAVKPLSICFPEAGSLT